MKNVEARVAAAPPSRPRRARPAWPSAPASRRRAARSPTKPMVRTKVIRRTIHVTKHAKPKHPAGAGPRAERAGAPARRRHGAGRPPAPRAAQPLGGVRTPRAPVTTDFGRRRRRSRPGHHRRRAAAAPAPAAPTPAARAGSRRLGRRRAAPPRSATHTSGGGGRGGGDGGEHRAAASGDGAATSGGDDERRAGATPAAPTGQRRHLGLDRALRGAVRPAHLPASRRQPVASGASTRSWCRKVIKRRVVTTIVAGPGGSTVSTGPVSRRPPAPAAESAPVSDERLLMRRARPHLRRDGQPRPAADRRAGPGDGAGRGGRRAGAGASSRTSTRRSRASSPTASSAR